MKPSSIEHASVISDELRLALLAAEAAGEVIAAGRGQLNKVEQKDVGDLVSQVDRDADQAALDVIRGECRLPVLSEELNSERPDADEFWVIDPLDATTSYLMQTGPQYPAVLVALRRGNETALGVTYFPLTDEWFYAQRGRGAWRNGKRLVCDSNELLSEVWVEMNQYGNSQLETDYFSKLRRRLRSADGARLVTNSAPYSGVAMRIATCETPLAVAIHDNNPHSPKQASWDIAAPQLILEEAGGVFLNPSGKRADPFRVEPIIVARSAALGHQVIQLGIREAARN